MFLKKKEKQLRFYTFLSKKTKINIQKLQKRVLGFTKY